MKAAARPNLAAGRAPTSLARLVGAICTAVGLAVVTWLTVLIYRGSREDDLVMVAVGIPLLLLIAWAGLFLVFGGLARFTARRR